MGRARASRPVPGLVLEVQVPPKMSVRAQIIKNGPNGVQNRRFGLKLGPEACQDRSGAFGTGLTHSKGPSPAWSWRSKSGPQCRFGPKSSKMARNGSRIDGLARNKDQMNPTACPDPSGPLLRPKTAKKLTFQGKRPPADPGGPRRPPFHRRPPGLGSYAGVM